ncbi:MAG: poly-gamma-glutamate hydrolase family protein [Ilumatobacteraceae bacterium]
MNRFAAALARADVHEEYTLASRFGFMAFHGGELEAMTDVVARRAADLAGASWYVVRHPADQAHFPSIEVDPAHSPALARFLDHVEVVVTVHGFGRHDMFTTLLLGGSNRVLADHVATHLGEHLPEYELRTDLDTIPRALRGTHPRNPVNLPRDGGVQIELPPRVRGSSPIWKDWTGPGLVPHTESLIAGLAQAARAWTPAS